MIVRILRKVPLVLMLAVALLFVFTAAYAALHAHHYGGPTTLNEGTVADLPFGHSCIGYESRGDVGPWMYADWRKLS